MAIAGLLIHTQEKYLKYTESMVVKMKGMTSHGCHQNQYLVVVAEAPSKEMEKRVKIIEELEGVLTIYVTYLTLEDEIEGKMEDGLGTP